MEGIEPGLAEEKRDKATHQEEQQGIATAPAIHLQ
jgi:hypothetical protein